ncbi:MAG: branched chain amino acid aminotransferase, partial [Spirochaeta sp.]|nr:branched chain amino acid aminotransferase [Spirochaeta sp.]
MARSMEGLLMPPYPKELFVDAVREVVKRNKSLGFTPAYDSAWEKDDFLSAY